MTPPPISPLIAIFFLALILFYTGWLTRLLLLLTEWVERLTEWLKKKRHAIFGKDLDE